MSEVLAMYSTRMQRSLRGCSFKLSFGLCLFRDGFCLDFFGFLFALPFLDRLAYEPHEIMESWGIKYFDKSVHLNWGRHCKIIWMPWLRERVQCDVQRPDGTWVPKAYPWNGDEPDGRVLYSFPYRYVLRSGEVQNVTAKVHVERSRYVWRCLRKIPLLWSFWAWDRYIDIEFSGEVGERAGSWKGGCIGCAYEMKQGETPEQTLRRMERERKF